MNRCAVALLWKRKRILLGKRSAQRRMYPKHWDLIGGHCEPNETMDQTLVRELAEEIGITDTIFDRIDMLDEPRSDEYGIYEYHVYLVSKWRGVPHNLQLEEHSEIRWFLVKDAVRLELAHPGYPNLFKRIECLLLP